MIMIFVWLFVLYIGIAFLIALFETICEIGNELFELGLNILNALNNLIKIIFSPRSYDFLTFKNFDTIIRRFIGCFNIFFRQIFNNIIGKKTS
jgi:hypothetical protein